jgi:hypothetical protein
MALLRMRIPPALGGILLLLVAGCSDILGPGREDTLGLWIRETGVVLEPGESMTLSARVQLRPGTEEGRQAGTDIVPPRRARWWTDNEAVLRVPDESQGRIEALAPGRATVWVQVGSRRDSANVTVLRAGEVPTRGLGRTDPCLDRAPLRDPLAERRDDLRHRPWR